MKSEDRTWILIVIAAAIVFFLIGAEYVSSKNKDVEGYTLIKNESNEWYWLENQQSHLSTISAYYTLKNILVSNECVDGGFIENVDGNEFLIVCYEAKKILRVDE